MTAALAVVGALPGQVTASYTLTRDGCNGTASATCLTQNESPMTFGFTSSPSDYAIPVVNTIGGPLAILGFEIFTTSITNALETAPTYFYRDNSGAGATAHTVPTAAAEAAGTIQVGGVQNWWRTSVYPVPIVQPGEAFWIGFNPQARIAPPLNLGGLPGAARMVDRRPNINNNAWVVFSAPGEPAFRIRCSNAAGVPWLRNQGLPRIGQPMTLTCDNGMPLLPAIMLFGTNTVTWAGGFLPLDLAGFGAPGCFLYQSSNSFLFFQADAQGVMNMTFTMPNNTRLLGVTFYNQAAMFTPSNALGLLTSNLGRGIVGN